MAIKKENGVALSLSEMQWKEYSEFIAFSTIADQIPRQEYVYKPMCLWLRVANYKTNVLLSQMQ